MKKTVNKITANLVASSLLLLAAYAHAGNKQTVTTSGLLSKYQVQPDLNINSKKIALVGGTIISPHLSMPINNATILIENGMITAINPESMQVSKQYQQIDAANQWILPGLIDSHVHLFQSASIFTRPDQFDLTGIQSYQADRDWVNNHMSDTFTRYMQSGVTSIVDMGGPNWNFSVKQLANHQIIAPRMNTAGPLIGPIDMPILDIDGVIFEKITTAQQAVESVKQQLTFKPDLIKIVWTPEVGHSPDQLSTLFSPAIELAHAHGLPVAVHVEKLTNAKAAIRAGADILVHGVLMEAVDDEFVVLAKGNNIIYMPTLASQERYMDIFSNSIEFSPHEIRHTHPDVINSFEEANLQIDKADKMFQLIRKHMPYVGAAPEELAKLDARAQSIVNQLADMFSTKVIKVQQENLKRMFDEGITLALGTDAGNPGTVHGGSMLIEMMAWRQAGIPLDAILSAATINNAKVTKDDGQLGSIEVGKYADLIILDKNPLVAVENFSSINTVIKHGNVLAIETIDKHVSELRVARSK